MDIDINEFIDLESAKERFMENEALYKRFLFEFRQRTLYEELNAALEKKDAEEAFQVAHRMKGIIENLSLNLLSKYIEETVEILRKGNFPPESLLALLADAYRQAVENILYIEENDVSLF